jgi:hypothetical protein
MREMIHRFGHAALDARMHLGILAESAFVLLLACGGFLICLLFASV